MAEQLAEWTYYDDEKASLKWTQDGSTVTVTDGGDNSYTYTIPSDKVFTGMTLTVNGTVTEWPKNTAYEFTGGEKVTLNGDIVTIDDFDIIFELQCPTDVVILDGYFSYGDTVTFGYTLTGKTLYLYATSDTGKKYDYTYEIPRAEMLDYVWLVVMKTSETVYINDKITEPITITIDDTFTSNGVIAVVAHFMDNTEKSTFTLNLDEQ